MATERAYLPSVSEVVDTLFASIRVVVSAVMSMLRPALSLALLATSTVLVTLALATANATP